MQHADLFKSRAVEQVLKYSNVAADLGQPVPTEAIAGSEQPAAAEGPSPAASGHASFDPAVHLLLPAYRPQGEHCLPSHQKQTHPPTPRSSTPRDQQATQWSAREAGYIYGQPLHPPPAAGESPGADGEDRTEPLLLGTGCDGPRQCPDDIPPAGGCLPNSDGGFGGFGGQREAGGQGPADPQHPPQGHDGCGARVITCSPPVYGYGGGALVQETALRCSASSGAFEPRGNSRSPPGHGGPQQHRAGNAQEAALRCSASSGAFEPRGNSRSPPGHGGGVPPQQHWTDIAQEAALRCSASEGFESRGIGRWSPPGHPQQQQQQRAPDDAALNTHSAPEAFESRGYGGGLHLQQQHQRASDDAQEAALRYSTADRLETRGFGRSPPGFHPHQQQQQQQYQHRASADAAAGLRRSASEGFEARGGGSPSLPGYGGEVDPWAPGPQGGRGFEARLDDLGRDLTTLELRLGGVEFSAARRKKRDGIGNHLRLLRDMIGGLVEADAPARQADLPSPRRLQLAPAAERERMLAALPRDLLAVQAGFRRRLRGGKAESDALAKYKAVLEKLDVGERKIRSDLKARTQRRRRLEDEAEAQFAGLTAAAGDLRDSIAGVEAGEEARLTVLWGEVHRLRDAVDEVKGRRERTERKFLNAFESIVGDLASQLKDERRSRQAAQDKLRAAVATIRAKPIRLSSSRDQPPDSHYSPPRTLLPSPLGANSYPARHATPVPRAASPGPATPVPTTLRVSPASLFTHLFQPHPGTPSFSPASSNPSSQPRKPLRAALDALNPNRTASSTGGPSKPSQRRSIDLQPRSIDLQPLDVVPDKDGYKPRWR
ncbi:hypothetical protein DIPPA_22532 [Diplonema papillatum]|nr:hypothetical protein DIPPA_22532 [Diplonema papillatum]